VHSVENDPGLSTEVFLRPAVAEKFYETALFFLRAFFDTITLTGGQSLRAEFERALGRRGNPAEG
jgi:hypothetical protein